VINVSTDNLEKYEELCESYDQDILDAFIESFSENDLEFFEDAYYGTFSSGAELAESIVSDTWDMQVPDFVCIDWERTWECNLRYDFIFDEKTGAAFNRNW
jgi:hypothetical protein